MSHPSPNQTTDPDHARWFSKGEPLDEQALGAYLWVRLPKVRESAEPARKSSVAVLRAKSAVHLRQAKAFLFLAARNAVLELFRRQSTILRQSLPDSPSSVVLDGDTYAGDIASQKRESEILLRAISAMPKRWRRTMTLRYAEGLSPREIAIRLSLSADLVESHLTQGVDFCTDYFIERGLVDRGKAESVTAFDQDETGGTASIQIEAARWLCRRDDGLTTEEEAEFARWLAGDPLRPAVVRRVEQTRLILGKLALADEIPWYSGAIFLRTAAVAAALALLVSLWWLRPRPGTFEQTYATSAEGLDEVSLPDGSTMMLNARTEVAVAYTAAIRRVTLKSGEAHFQVAKNKARPFIVDAGSVTVRAVGTAFDVRWSDKSVEVLVTEGRVQVRRETRVDRPTQSFFPALVVRGDRLLHRPAVPPPIFVGAGESATVPLAGPVLPEVRPVPPLALSEKLGWEEARLTFASTPLAQVAREFNQHNSVQLILADRELDGLPLVGSFRPDNLEGFVRLLEDGQKVTVERSGNAIILHKPR